ncbi:hypothetical protein [Pseudomonas fluorescens]|uniref:hypothetical protein n=1 Tax=Pseudomonas fluorescens TaxID=294 RepID=UPI000AB2AD86|nr:hypothetical protein [Pseudomonas fluorescens]
MGEKLQNFAKAAILAIAQQNCSIPDALPGTPSLHAADWQHLNVEQCSLPKYASRLL